MMCDAMNELISVIIPVYKVEAYLTACVESVLAQTYENIEIILVDDGSPDGCPKMCDVFANRDSRIRVIHKGNGGLSSARNAGIDVAKGEYLAFLDSDDLWTPLFLERLHTALTEVGADFAVCLFRRFLGEPPTDVPASCETTAMTQRQAFECLFNIRNENMVVAPNKLYRRELFDVLRYPLGQIHEDEAVIHEIIGTADRIAWVEEAHYLYREAPDSIMTSHFSLKRLDMTVAKERRISYFEKREMYDLADRTRIVYMNNLMWLYRTIQINCVGSSEEKQAAINLYKRFVTLYDRQLLQGESVKMRIRFALFKAIPKLFSKLEHVRLSCRSQP